MPGQRRGAAHGGNCLDLVRLGLAALVLLSHSYALVDGNLRRESLTQAFHTISFGELAVDCFFVLSGFLITQSWDNDPRALAFLRKRVLRIYPGFAAAFLVSVFVVGAVGAPDVAGYLRHVHVASDFKDIVFLRSPSSPPVFVGSHYAAVNGSLWTIRFEFMCYLLVLGLGVAGALRGKWPVVVLWICLSAGFLVFRFSERHAAVTGAIAGGDAVTLLRFVPIFLSGAVIYKTGLYQVRRPWLVALALAVLLVGMCNKVTAEVALAAAGGYLMLVAGLALSRPRRLAKLPDISYGVYLYGWPSQKLVIYAGVNAPLAVFWLSLVMAVCLGWLSWKFVEGPGLRFKHTHVEGLNTSST